MSATPLMALGLRALAANYAAMQTSGHNIANANVAGYTRQQVELATAGGQYTGRGFIGNGVDAKTVSRAQDAFLVREAATTASLAAMDAARLARLRPLETIFATGEQGIGHAASIFLNTFGDLATRPGDTATRQVVLARAGELALRFNAAGEQFAEAQRTVTEQLKVDVTTINSLAQQIAAVNAQIVAVRGQGQPPNDLLDQRDRLVTTLSTKVQVTTLHADDGSLGVFVAGGQHLVLGVQSREMQAVADRSDPTRSAVAMVAGNAVHPLAAEALGGGSLAGLLRFQNDDLVQARSQLGQLAAGLSAAVNEQQQRGLDLREPSGAGAPLFVEIGDLVQTEARPGAGNARDAQGNFVAAPTLSVVDASALQASEYALFAVDDAGTPRWTLQRLADGALTTLQPGVPVDGLQIDLGSPAPAVGDRFLLQPLATVASRIGVLLGSPRELAAAAALSASVLPGNAGTAAVAALTITSSAVDPQQTALITFGADASDYTWELRDRDSNALTASGSGRWQAGAPIPAPPDADINGFALQLAGVPAPGDRLRIERTPYAQGHNGNALALGSLADAALVGQLQGRAVTIGDAHAAMIASIGVRVQGARAGAEMSQAMATQAEQRRAEVGGVNLDEEAARLIQFQQSYQAAAKVLQVAQAVFDTLLQSTRS